MRQQADGSKRRTSVSVFGALLLLTLAAFFLAGPPGVGVLLLVALVAWAARAGPARRLAELEAAMVEKENLAEVLAEVCPSGCAFLDRELVFRQVSSAFCRHFEREEAHFIGRGLFDVFKGAEAQIGEAVRHVIETGEPFKAQEHPFVYEDDRGRHEAYWDFSCCPVADRAGRVVGLVGLGMDVSQRVRLSRESSEHLRGWVRSEKKFEAVFEHAPMGIALGDPEGKRFVAINTAVTGILGYTEAELCRMDVAAFSHPEDLALDARLFDELVAGKRDGYRMEKRFIRKDGRVIWARLAVALIRDGDGVPQYSLGMVEDITERKRMEADLGRALGELEKLFETIPDILYELDLDGRLVRWNRRLEDVTGYAANELTGKNALAFFPEAEHERIRQSIREKIDKGFSRVEGHLRRKDGTLVPYLWAGAALKDRFGNVLGVTGVGKDITESKRLEDALRLQNEQLKALDRLKLNLINTVSHELRTPLSSIFGYAEFLEDELVGPLTSEQLAFVKGIEDGAHRLRHLVDDLLDFARLEAGTFRLYVQENELFPRLEAVAEMLRPQAEAAGVALNVVLPEEPIVMYFDPPRVSQVLLNLLSNAIKFTPAGGRVTIEACRLSDEVRIQVTDTGIGIAPEHLPCLFEKFYQVDSSSTREKGGAGLGLSISRAIVEAHGGCIGAESTPGAGSTFWFSLPCSRPAGVRAITLLDAPPLVSPERPPGGSARPDRA